MAPSLLFEGRCLDRPAMEKRAAAPAPKRVTCVRTRAALFVGQGTTTLPPLTRAACEPLVAARRGKTLSLTAGSRAKSPIKCRAGAVPDEGPQTALEYKRTARPKGPPPPPLIPRGQS